MYWVCKLGIHVVDNTVYVWIVGHAYETATINLLSSY